MELELAKDYQGHTHSWVRLLAGLTGALGFTGGIGRGVIRARTPLPVSES